MHCLKKNHFNDTIISKYIPVIITFLNHHVRKGFWEKNESHKEHLKLVGGHHHQIHLTTGQGSMLMGFQVEAPESQNQILSSGPPLAICLSSVFVFCFLIEFLETSWGLYFLQVQDNPSYFLLLLPSSGPRGQTCKNVPHASRYMLIAVWEPQLFPPAGEAFSQCS